MATLIEHSGQVERIEDEIIFVKIISHSACSSCSARGACGLSESQDKIVEVHTFDVANYAVGENVMVGISKNTGVLSVFFVYVLSLAVLLGVLVVALNVLGWSEGVGVVAAILSLGGYFSLLWVFRKKLESKIQITITKNY